jgi:predicted anti-sigma-YlaC factor YlaD
VNCDTARELLSERLDDLLDADLAAETDEHLARCASCRDLERDMAGVVAELAGLRELDGAPELADRIVLHVPSPVRLARASRPASRRDDVRRVAGWAAVMVAVSAALLGKGFSGRVADELAPIVAAARKEELRSKLSNQGLFGRLESDGAAKIESFARSARGKEPRR